MRRGASTTPRVGAVRVSVMEVLESLVQLTNTADRIVLDAKAARSQTALFLAKCNGTDSHHSVNPICVVLCLAATLRKNLDAAFWSW